ncbi:hypothetical protein T484DRAFT_1777716 [Baffinella frigidus]|nr:hypothetical protein T484DRAFT_1777716 [Cryptophyta sp. CCMP2293]
MARHEVASLFSLAAPLDVKALIARSLFFAGAAKLKGATGLVLDVSALIDGDGDAAKRQNVTRPRKPDGGPRTPPARGSQPGSTQEHARAARRKSMPAPRVSLHLNESQHTPSRITTDERGLSPPRNTIGIVRKSSSPESPDPPPAALVASIAQYGVFNISDDLGSVDLICSTEPCSTDGVPSFFKKRPPPMLSVKQLETEHFGDRVLREDSLDSVVIANAVRQLVRDRSASAPLSAPATPSFTPAAMRDGSSFTPHSGGGWRTSGSTCSPMTADAVGSPMPELVPTLLRSLLASRQRVSMLVNTATWEEALAPDSSQACSLAPSPHAAVTEPPPRQGVGLSPATSYKSSSSFESPPTPLDRNEATDSPIYAIQGSRTAGSASPGIRAWANAGRLHDAFARGTPQAFRRHLSGVSSLPATSSAPRCKASRRSLSPSPSP